MAFVLLHAPGNVSNPDVSFTAPTRPPRRARRRQTRRSSTTSYGRGTATTPGARAISRIRQLDPPFRHGWSFEDYRAARVSAGHLPARRCICSRQRWLCQGDQRREWPSDLAAQGRHARGRIARARRPAAPRLRAGCCRYTVAAPGKRTVSWRCRCSTGRVVWSRHVASRHGVLADRVARQGVLRRSGRQRLRAEHPARATSTGHTTPPARSRAARRSPAAGSFSATTQAGPTRSTPQTATRFGRSSTSGTAVWFRLGQLLLDSGGRLRPRLHGQYRRPRVLLRCEQRGSSRGRPRPAPTSTPRPRSPTRPGSDRPSTSGPTTATSTRSTPTRARFAGGTTPGGKISGSPTIIGNVVYYSDLGSKTTAGVNVRTGRQVFSFSDGAFNPVITDGHAIYLVGYCDALPDGPEGCRHRQTGERQAAAPAQQR